MRSALRLQALVVFALIFPSTTHSEEFATRAVVRTAMEEVLRRQEQWSRFEMNVTSAYLYPSASGGEPVEHGRTINRVRLDGKRFVIENSFFETDDDGIHILKKKSLIMWDGVRYFSWDAADSPHKGFAFTGTDPELATSTLKDAEIGLWLDGRLGSELTVLGEILNMTSDLVGKYVDDSIYGRSIVVEVSRPRAHFKVWLTADSPHLLYRYSIDRDREQMLLDNPKSRVLGERDVVTIDTFSADGDPFPLAGTIDRHVEHPSAIFDTRVVIERSDVQYAPSDLALTAAIPAGTEFANLDSLGDDFVWDGTALHKKTQ